MMPGPFSSSDMSYSSGERRMSQLLSCACSTRQPDHPIGVLGFAASGFVVDGRTWSAQLIVLPAWLNLLRKRRSTVSCDKLYMRGHVYSSQTPGQPATSSHYPLSYQPALASERLHQSYTVLSVIMKRRERSGRTRSIFFEACPTQLHGPLIMLCVDGRLAHQFPVSRWPVSE